MTTTNHHLIHATPTLAPREAMYLRDMAQGRSVKEVAKAHGVSPNTVSGALKRIYYKLGAHRVAEAVYKATRAGLLGLMMALTVFSLVSDDPYIRAPRNRRPTNGPQVVRNPGRTNGRGEFGMLASLLAFGGIKKPKRKHRNQWREKTFAYLMDPPASNSQRLETYRLKRARVYRAERSGKPIPEFPMIVFRA